MCSLYRWMSSAKILAHHKDKRNLNPVCSGEMKARVSYSKMGGSAIAAESTNLCVQLCLGFLCRDAQRHPGLLYFIQSSQGLPTTLEIVENVSMTLQLRIFNSVSFCFCSCSYNAAFLHFIKENRRFLL